MKTFLKPRILIVGNTGFLGSSLTSSLQSMGFPVDSTDRRSLDFSKPIPKSFEASLQTGTYKYVIVCVAIADVEKCFKEPELSQYINVTGTLELLGMIQRSGAIPIFFSSDYVFAKGKEIYQEEDLREPETIYGRQKMTVEKHLEERFERFLIFRTSKLMSKTAHSKNILLPILRSLKESQPIRCFEDQWLNPVFVEDIAEVIQASCERDLSGVFHVGTRRVFNRAELGRFLATKLGYDPQLIQSISMGDIRFSEPRPTHNVLDCRKIEKALDFRFTEVEETLTGATFSGT